MKIKDILIIILLLILILNKNIVVNWNPPNKVQYKYIVKHDTIYEKDKNTITHVTLTVYQPLKSQCDGDPLTTYDGSKINLKHLRNGKIKWCAISQDLLYLFSKDKPKKILIDGYGEYEVRDVMNKRLKHSVDILIHPKNFMRIKKNNIKIEIIK